MRTFFALVEFTDANGVHAANQPVNLPYETPDQVAAVQSMLAYGVLAEQSPLPPQPNNENTVFAPPVVEPGPLVLAPNDENPLPTTSEEAVDDEDKAQDEAPKDNPETPYFDARDDSGKFVAEDPLAEETPAEEAPAEDAPAEETPAEETPEQSTDEAPKKRTSRKR